MPEKQALSFGPFTLDTKNRQLYRGNRVVKLTGKALSVLSHLVDRPEQLVTKEELFRDLWSETVVGDAALAVCIGELRRKLGDKARFPRYIETVHGQGYRFIALPSITPSLSQKSKVESQNSTLTSNTQHPAPPLVGRETELAQLAKWLENALAGQRRLVFVTGEAGIGKTTLVEAFLLGVRSWGLEARSSSPQAPRLKPQVSGMWIGLGQCIEQYGSGEAYLPLLEALGRLCRGPNGKQFLRLLEKHAPTWLVQLPTVVSANRLKTLQRQGQGATKERMLRELAEALEAITHARPLIFVLEDLHWSDTATIEILNFLARRREAARLYILGTYRPVEVIVREHKLKEVKQELQLHQQCEELLLKFLSEEAVNEYLRLRFPDNAFPKQLGTLVYERTDGNPLFMVNMVDEWVRQGVLRQQNGQWFAADNFQQSEAGAPSSIQQLIETQIERLSIEEQRVLEVGSVAGMEFSAAAVSAATEQTTEEVEAQCEGLARRGQFVQGVGMSEWPDGTVATRYRFTHALGQEGLYKRIPAARQMRLHQQIGERMEGGYGNRANEIATELAVHFERGREYRKAIQYLERAAQNAIRKSAYQEAVNLLSKGLELLNTIPDTSERTHQELTLQILIGAPLRATKGYGSSDVEKVYNRALELCEKVEKSPLVLRALGGLLEFYFVRAKLRKAHELGERLFSLAQFHQDPDLLLASHTNLEITSFFQGKLVPARSHLEQGIALYNPQKHHPRALQDPETVCLSVGSWILWHLGYPDQALKRSSEALTRAQDLGHPFSLALALFYASVLHQFRRNIRLTEEWTSKLIALSSKHGFLHWLTQGIVLRGWTLAQEGRDEEGVVQIREGLTASKATGSEATLPYFLSLLAKTCARLCKIEESLTILAEAQEKVENSGERWYEAELYRLKGELTQQRQSKVDSQKLKVANTQHPTPDTQTEAEAEACFQKAIDVALHQQAKLPELRASMSLARLWRQQGKQQEAHAMLSEIYGWFTEGFDTKDLQEAKALLQELE